MDNGLRLLKRAEEAGLTVTRVGDSLRIRGPKSAEAIVKELAADKEDVLAALDYRPKPEDELIERLQKGIDWFLAVDPKLWDVNNNPIKVDRKLEVKMMVSTLKWLELERLLRNLYEYDLCIFKDDGCPRQSPVRCTVCG